MVITLFIAITITTPTIFITLIIITITTTGTVARHEVDRVRLLPLTVGNLRRMAFPGLRRRVDV